MNAFNHTTNLYLLHLNNQENIFIYYMKRREFIGNTFAIGSLTSVIPISQLYSNVQKNSPFKRKRLTMMLSLLELVVWDPQLAIILQNKGIVF